MTEPTISLAVSLQNVTGRDKIRFDSLRGSSSDFVEKENGKSSLVSQERVFKAVATENFSVHEDLSTQKSVDNIFIDFQLETFNFDSNTESLQKNNLLYSNGKSTYYQKDSSVSMFTEDENKRYCQLLHILSSEEDRSQFSQLNVVSGADNVHFLSGKIHNAISTSEKFSANHTKSTVNKEELSYIQEEDSVFKESMLRKSFTGFTKVLLDQENLRQRSKSVDFLRSDFHKRMNSGIFTATPKNPTTYRTKSSISKELEKRLDIYRNNEMVMLALQEKVRKYKSEIKQELPRSYENMVSKNKRTCVELSPKKQQDLLHERASMLTSRMLKAQERREKIVTEFKEQTKRKINLRNEQRLEREWKSVVGGYIEAWQTIICLVKMVTFFTDMIEKLKLKQIEEEKRLIKEQMEKEKQELKEKLKNEELQRIRNEFRSIYKKELHKITAFLMPHINRWRHKRQVALIPIIRSFLNDLTETFKIPLAMTRYKNVVLQIQKYYREYRAMNAARSALIKLQVDGNISKKMEDLEKQIEEEKKRLNKLIPASYRSGNLNLKNLSLRYLMNQRGSSMHLFNLIGQLEELRKIDEYVKMKYIKTNMVERRREHMKQMEFYEMYMKNADYSNPRKVSFALSNKYHPVNSILETAKKPRFKLILDKESIENLVEQMRSHTRELIMSQRRRIRRSKLKLSINEFFRNTDSPTLKAKFIRSNNFEFLGAPTFRDSNSLSSMNQ